GAFVALEHGFERRDQTAGRRTPGGAATGERDPVDGKSVGDDDERRGRRSGQCSSSGPGRSLTRRCRLTRAPASGAGCDGGWVEQCETLLTLVREVRVRSSGRARGVERGDLLG